MKTTSPKVQNRRMFIASGKQFGKWLIKYSQILPDLVAISLTHSPSPPLLHSV